MKNFDGIEDFEANIEILSSEEGGRTTPAFNGIRWDFCYSEDDVKDGLYMIHPDFFGTDGESLEGQLPIGKPLNARMKIIVEEMKEKMHRKRIKVGTEFYCHEGARRVAKGKVSKITGLKQND